MVKPASRTQRAKRATCGLMPGISAITITAGPLPATWTRLMTPLSVMSRCEKSSKGSSAFMLRPVTVSAGVATLTDNFNRLAVGAASSGQLDLAVGQVGRLDDPASVSVPNGVNPDLVLGWTCNSATTCGTAAAGPSVAVQAFGVTVQQGSMAISAPSNAPPVVTPAQIGPTATYGVANERSYVNLGLADLDGGAERNQ